MIYLFIFAQKYNTLWSLNFETFIKKGCMVGIFILNQVQAIQKRREYHSTLKGDHLIEKIDIS